MRPKCEPLHVAPPILCPTLFFCASWHSLLFLAALTVWCGAASVGFMAQLVPEDRKSLGVYPVFLFYLTISWMVLLQ